MALMLDFASVLLAQAAGLLASTIHGTGSVSHPG